MTPKARRLVTALALSAAALALASDAQAQWGQQQAPAWGQFGNTAWGQYGNNLSGGWNYNKSQTVVEPQGTVLNPNQNSGNFSNSSTGAGLFQPQDTRLRGRDRP
jgi:hypothetical protein